MPWEGARGLSLAEAGTGPAMRESSGVGENGREGLGMSGGGWGVTSGCKMALKL